MWTKKPVFTLNGLPHLVIFQSQQQQKERKLGHRRVGGDGEVTYKKFHTTQLMGSIQLGMQQSVGSLAGMDNRHGLEMGPKQ